MHLPSLLGNGPLVSPFSTTNKKSSLPETTITASPKVPEKPEKFIAQANASNLQYSERFNAKVLAALPTLEAEAITVKALKEKLAGHHSQTIQALLYRMMSKGWVKRKKISTCTRDNKYAYWRGDAE